jgi:hypothetical protein
VVAGVVVRIADADAEDDAGKQLAERLPGFGEAAPYRVSQVVVRGIAGHREVQAEDGRCGDNHPAVPSAFGTVEPVDEEES